MADRYISRNSLFKLLDDYKDINRWNPDAIDPDTVSRVLSVIVNELEHFETIGPRQLSSKLLAAKDAALAFYAEQARMDMERYRESERAAESINSPMTCYWRGMRDKTEEYLSIFTRLRKGNSHEAIH